MQNLTLSLSRSFGLRLSLGSPLLFILSATCPAQAPNWVQVQPKNSPSGRWTHSMSYDFVRARTVLFGGSSSGVPHQNDTWEFDGTNWTKMNPKTVPPGRRTHAMVFHLARVTTVMFGGGKSGGGYLNDTWTWDGKDWRQMKPQNSPSARFAPAMTYDSGRARTVLFGGFNGSFLNDTWEWDGQNWTQIKTANAPSIRYTEMTYDSARRRVVLFGGFRNGMPQIKETWEYDGKNWTKMNPTTEPQARCCHNIMYDPDRQRTVMFGGQAPRNVSETWEYDGKTWTRINTATSPPVRSDHDGMVYDLRRKRMVMFGGSGGAGLLGDTWEYVASQPLTGTPATISIASGGTHAFSLDAGTAHANRLYWIFGSVTGTSPGVTLVSPAGSVNIPLNPDFYTDITIALANSPLLTKTRGALDAAGKGSASFHVPKITNQSAIGVKFYHASLVYDAQSNFYMASNPVELTLVK